MGEDQKVRADFKGEIRIELVRTELHESGQF